MLMLRDFFIERIIMNKKDIVLREEIAELIHKEWVEWAKCIENEVSNDRKQRWETVYGEYQSLSEKMKDKDRVYADKIIELLKSRKVID